MPGKVVGIQLQNHPISGWENKPPCLEKTFLKKNHQVVETVITDILKI
jgi:hypothetical protein